MKTRILTGMVLVASALMLPLRADNNKNDNNQNDKHQSVGSLRVFIDQPSSGGGPAIRGTFDIRRFAASEDGKILNAIGVLSITDGSRTAVTTTAIPVVSI